MNTTFRSTRVDPSGTPGHERKRPKFRQLLLAALLVMFLVSVYLEVPLYLTSTLFIPSFPTLIFLVPVLAAVYYRKIYKYEALFVGQVFFVLLLSALLSPGLEHLGQKLLGLLQTLVSISSGILLLKLINDLPRKWIARILFALSVLLVVGTSLEVVGLLRGVSDAFRGVVYGGESGYFVYDSEERDAGITGFARPKFFTSEPSLLAIGFFAFVNSWLLLDYSNKNLILACLGTLLMLGLTGSPILALSLAVTLIVMLRHRSGFFVKLSLPVLLGFAVLALAVLNPVVISDLVLRLDDSLGGYSVLNPTSEQIRLVFPFITLVDVTKASPLFGVGISGKEVIDSFSSLPVAPDLALGTNALAAILTYLGILGSLLFIKVFRDYLLRMKIREIALLIVFVLALSQMMSGVESPRFWGYVFLFIGLMKLRSTTELLPESGKTSTNKEYRGTR
jgi:hypothetical protein